MRRSGAADLPLHYGYVPAWLAERMAKLGLAITETLVAEYGKKEMLRRLSDPFWFQSLGAVMGMDWHSSGITTSVMGALKRAVNPHSRQLGIYICGGKGKCSHKAPEEIFHVCETTGLDANSLVRCSKLSAKVDNTAVQDGFQLYTHNFILSDEGDWTVIQQGMSEGNRTARRYHWHSDGLASFVEAPHAAVCGVNQGLILNLTDGSAATTRNGVLFIATEKPEHLMRDIQQLVLPAHHDVRKENVDIRRLGAMLWLTHERQPSDFEELLLLQGLGPRTLQSLALVSEVIHGTPSRFRDPARFSFAHGGKDGHPFPVPTQVYDETIAVLQLAIHRSNIGNSDKQDAIRSLHKLVERVEKDFTPTAQQNNPPQDHSQPDDEFQRLIEKERAESWKYGGRTVFGKAKPPDTAARPQQLRLF